MSAVAATWQPAGGLQRRGRARAALQAPLRAPTAPAETESLRSTWAHRGWVAAGCTAVGAALAKSAAAAVATGHLVEPVAAAAAGYFLADLGSGVFHWAIDNYGDASTPAVGSQIEAFQGHHRFPWTITRREFANNLHALGRAVAAALLPVTAGAGDAGALAFAASFAGFVMFSQQFHAWSHTPKSRLPPAVVALQDAGLLVSRRQHALHHRAPYNNNYCIVSGVWNEFLDESSAFEALEMVIFFRFGVRPRSWSEPESNWTEEKENLS
ncbi:fatty acid desaturase A [Wolffia australiana]